MKLTYYCSYKSSPVGFQIGSLSLPSPSCCTIQLSQNNINPLIASCFETSDVIGGFGKHGSEGFLFWQSDIPAQKEKTPCYINLAVESENWDELEYMLGRGNSAEAEEENFVTSAVDSMILDCSPHFGYSVDAQKAEKIAEQRVGTLLKATEERLARLQTQDCVFLALSSPDVNPENVKNALHLAEVPKAVEDCIMELEWTKDGKLTALRKKPEKKTSSQSQSKTLSNQKNRGKRHNASSLIVSVCVLAAIVASAYFFHEPQSVLQYLSAEKALKSGDYERAAVLYRNLGDYYKGSQEKADICVVYEEAADCLESGNVKLAGELYSSISEFGDSADLAAKCNTYSGALADLENGLYSEAANQFDSIRGFQNSDDLSAKCRTYVTALNYLEQGGYDEARASFESISGFADSDKLTQECAVYVTALTYLENGQYSEAAADWDQIPDFSNSYEQALKCRSYLEAVELLAGGSYQKAAECFDSLGGFSDSLNMAATCYTYIEGFNHLEQGNYVAAAERFEEIDSFENSTELASKCRKYIEADSFYANGDYESARTLFESILYFSDCVERNKECSYFLAVQRCEEGHYKEAADLFIEIGAPEYRDSVDIIDKILGKLLEIEDNERASAMYDLLHRNQE